MSERVRRFLAAMPRQEPAGLDPLRHAVERAGHQFPQLWAEFHDEFAGYTERIGLSRLVWGLVHRSPAELPARGFNFEFDEDELWVACADAHGSYDYNISPTGAFWGGSTDSFTVYVERRAYFSSQEGVLSEVDKPSVDQLQRASEVCQLDFAASDSQAQLWVGDGICMFDRAGHVALYRAD